MIDETANCIKFSKIGNIRTIVHREIDDEVKGIIIKRSNLGKWYAIVQLKKDVQPLSITGKDVGLDVGISKFVTDTEKNEFEYPNNIDNTLKKIRSQHRELSRKKKGSNAYKIAKHKLAITYQPHVYSN